MIRVSCIFQVQVTLYLKANKDRLGGFVMYHYIHGDLPFRDVISPECCHFNEITKLYFHSSYKHAVSLLKIFHTQNLFF